MKLMLALSADHPLVAQLQQLGEAAMTDPRSYNAITHAFRLKLDVQCIITEIDQKRVFQPYGHDGIDLRAEFAERTFGAVPPLSGGYAFVHLILNTQKATVELEPETALT